MWNTLSVFEEMATFKVSLPQVEAPEVNFLDFVKLSMLPQRHPWETLIWKEEA